MQAGEARRWGGSVLIALATFGAGCGGARSQPPPEIEVVDAFATAGDQSIAVYLSLANTGGPDRITAAELTGASAGLAERITLHTSVERDGLSIMEATDSIEVAAAGATGLEPGSGHLMLERLSAPVKVGDELTLRLRLDRSGPLTATVEVIPLGQALDRVNAGEDDR